MHFNSTTHTHKLLFRLIIFLMIKYLKKKKKQKSAGIDYRILVPSN